MAAKQALAVHRGISYDLEVDTDGQRPEEAARLISQHFFGNRLAELTRHGNVREAPVVAASASRKRIP